MAHAHFVGAPAHTCTPPSLSHPRTPLSLPPHASSTRLRRPLPPPAARSFSSSPLPPKVLFALGYVVLAVWLVTLFYLLGNTAADYFCCCLEKLSNLLNLPPTVAGVTLLPLGNGAPDVFASIAAFVGRDSGEVGLNSVLGGACFVICVVVGAVSLSVSEQNVRIDKRCFIRDACFFFVALVALLVILLVGKVSVAGAIAFVSIYVVYALCVAANEIISKYAWGFKLDSVPSLLPVTEKKLPIANGEEESVQSPLLESDSTDVLPHLHEKVPHWMWASNVAIYSNEVIKVSDLDSPKLLWRWNEDETINDQSSSSCWLGYLLVGLDISLLIGAWSSRPASYIVPRDSSLYPTLGFVILGLVWSVVVLPCKSMRPTKLLGLGLMVIYLVFLSFRASFVVGDTSLDL